MNKSQQMIMAVERDLLFGRDHFEGFIPHGEIDYEARILRNIKYMKRGPLEEDPSHKQPIGYALIVNPGRRMVFAYKRAEQDESYAEKRLQGKWSWGIGGHIEEDKEGTGGNPIHNSLLREVSEEVRMDGQITNITKLGYINREVGVHQVHFGILYLIETDSTEVKPEDSEIAQGGLMGLGQLEEILYSNDCVVEEWSLIAFSQLKRQL